MKSCTTRVFCSLSQKGGGGNFFCQLSDFLERSIDLQDSLSFFPAYSCEAVAF